MKRIFVLIPLAIFASCKNTSDSKIADNTLVVKDTIFIHDTIYINMDHDIDWQRSFGLTHDPQIDSIWGKPVSHYIEDEECSVIAIEFYYGSIRPFDNGTTIELLKLACNDNDKLRPFYRWCLNKTIAVSDGALAEYIGVPARQYAEKFPDEFFEYMDIEKTSDKYECWVTAIGYSGFFDRPDFGNYKKQREELIKRMTKNLKGKSAKNKERIRKFAEDCTTIYK